MKRRGAASGNNSPNFKTYMHKMKENKVTFYRSVHVIDKSSSLHSLHCDCPSDQTFINIVKATFKGRFLVAISISPNTNNKISTTNNSNVHIKYQMKHMTWREECHFSFIWTEFDFFFHVFFFLNFLQLHLKFYAFTFEYSKQFQAYVILTTKTTPLEMSLNKYFMNRN